MNRSQRRAIRALRSLPHAWEVVLVETDLVLEGMEVEGLVAILEEGTGAVRFAGPLARGASLWTVLQPALEDPIPPSEPGRPRALLCDDPRLRLRLDTALEGTRIRTELVSELPTARAVLDSMEDLIQPDTVPGITTRLDEWRTSLEQLSKVAPWRHVPPEVEFRFSGIATLSEAVVQVMGSGGMQVGIGLYPTEEDLRLWLDMVNGSDPDALGELVAVNLYLDPMEELTPQEIRACVEADVITSDGFHPRVQVLDRGAPAPASDAAQLGLLAAIQAVTALVEAHGGALRRVPAELPVTTCLGRLVVHATPPGWSTRSLVPYAHAAGILRVLHPTDGTHRVGVVLKLRKPDANKLARDLASVDEVVLRGTEGSLSLHASARGIDLGRLVDVPEPSEVERLRQAEPLFLCVSAGGPKRPTVRTSEYVLWRPVVLVDASEPLDREPSPRHDPIFDGPVETWPKASETLLAFIHPLVANEQPTPETLSRFLQLATTVWNATVMADFDGNAKMLAELRQSVAKEPGPALLVETLIQHKRRRFGGDPRLLADAHVGPGADGPRVHVTSRSLPGYPLG